MSEIRPQYHLRRIRTGIDAFDVRRLIDLSRCLPVKMIDPRTIRELDENHWYFQSTSEPTPRSFIEHMQLVQACELSHPIILDARGRVMDGMHRICKAVLEGVEQIPVVQFDEDPEPDFVNCDPDALPYDWI